MSNVVRRILIYRDAFGQFRWEYEHPDYGHITSPQFASYGDCYDDATCWANTPAEIISAPGCLPPVTDTTHEVITDD